MQPTRREVLAAVPVAGVAAIAADKPGLTVRMAEGLDIYVPPAAAGKIAPLGGGH